MSGPEHSPADDMPATKEEYEAWEREQAAAQADGARGEALPDELGLVDQLAADIRAIDGKHDMGAGALAERLVERGWHRAPAPDAIARLTAENERLTRERDEAVDTKEFYAQTHATRIRWLEDFFRGPGKELPVANQFWNIIANGTPDITTPPTYQQLLNRAKHRAEAAESRAETAERELAAARKQLAAAERTGWRDIATAPKDGTRILFCETGVQGIQVVSQGYWCEDEGWYETNTHPTDVTGGQCYPTHWMPLPAPPAASEDQP